MRHIALASIVLAMACAVPARAAADLPTATPPPPSKTLPVASAPAMLAPSRPAPSARSLPSVALPSLDPPKPAPPAAPAACVARPLTGPRFRAGAITSKLWPTGTNLRIYFHGGDERIVARVLDDFRRGWGADANLTLTRVTDPAQSDVRFTFRRGGGNYSLIGTDARTQPGQATGNLDIGPETPPEEIRRLGEHEIGHALGLVHNMSLPDPGRRLNKAAMTAYYQRTQGWSYQQAAAQVEEVAATTLHPASTVDFDSIMQYYVPPEADRLGIGVGWITDLSPGDRKSARDFWPGRAVGNGTTTPGTTTPAPGTKPAPPSPGTPPPPSGPPTIRATHRGGSPPWTGSLSLDAQQVVTLNVRVIGVRPPPAPRVVVAPLGSPWSGLILAMGAGEDGAFARGFRAGPGRYVVTVGFESVETFEFEVSAAR